jgi:hypothetical protein
MNDKEYAVLESQFTSQGSWSCNHCGELVQSDVDAMEYHLMSCEESEESN